MVSKTSDSSHLSPPRAVVLPAQIGLESPRADSSALLSVSWGERQRIAECRLPVKLALYRGGESERSRVARRDVAHSTQPFPPTDVRCGSRCRRRRLAGPRGSAEGTMRQLPQQLAGDSDPQGGDGGRVMPLGANAATLAAGSSAAAGGLIIQHGRRGLRGEKDSSR